MKKTLAITKPRHSKHVNFSRPLAIHYIEVPLYSVKSSWVQLVPPLSNNFFVHH